MRKAQFDASAILILLIVALLAAGIVFVVFSLRPDPINESFSGDRVINTLFVIEQNGKPLCSYVLLYYPVTKRASVFDIPGSLGQIIQSINRMDRIDTIYDPRKAAPFASEIEKVLGIDISFSIVITLENLGKLTDLIEGVEIFIPSPVDEYQEGHILFPSGVNNLDGDKARVYITYELPEESRDLAYFRRQRFFIGFIKRLGEQNLYLKNPQAAQIFQSLLKTGSSGRTTARLFDEFAGIDTDRVTIQSVGGNVREVSGQPLIFPHWDGELIKDIVRQTLGSLVQPAEGTAGDRIFTVEILNGTNVSGLAGRTAELFRGFGYNVISIGNAESSNYEKTIIIDRSGFQGMAVIFGDVIRCTNIQLDTQADSAIDLDIRNYEYRPDFTLIIGRDFNERYVTD
jgi:anionic cell wall polymer biosynthesis LytR-Cps2A-Psr (LCP) family protein